MKMKRFTDCRCDSDRDNCGLCAAGIAECYDGCPFYFKVKKPTNADRIRSLFKRTFPRKRLYWYQYYGVGGGITAYGVGDAKRKAWERAKIHYSSVTFDQFCKEVCISKF